MKKTTRKQEPQEFELQESVPREVWKKVRDGIAGGIAIVFLAALAGIFTPVGDWILDRIPDTGTVSRVDGPDEVVVGEKFYVDPFIAPSGHLRHAVLHVERSMNIDQMPRQRDYTLGKVADASAFSKLHNGALQFQALEVGTASIACQLLSGDRVIGSATPKVIPIRRHHAYDGDWTIKIKDTSGTMHLEEMPDDTATVYGFYALTTHVTGLVSGTFDGAKFSGFLTIGNAPSRFELLGDTADHNGTISVTGRATQFSVDGGTWKPTPGQAAVALVLTQND